MTKTISISPGNRKMGLIPSVSLPPVITCAYGCKCANKCYAAKLCRIYPTVRAAYERNLEILMEDPDCYWAQLGAILQKSRYFRLHVSGDFLDSDYLRNVAHLARQNPDCQILAFTKQYDMVNDHLEVYGSIPANLHIIFSAWPGMPMENPHGLPVAHVIFRGEDPAPDWKICGGNCATCACQGVGCWELQPGEHIAFYEH